MLLHAFPQLLNVNALMEFHLHLSVGRCCHQHFEEFVLYEYYTGSSVISIFSENKIKVNLVACLVLGLR